MIFPLFSSIFANTCGKPLSRTIKKNSRLDRLNGFSSRYECEQNAKIVCFFVTQNSFLLVPFAVGWSPYFSTGSTLFPFLCFHNSGIRPLLIFSLLLTTMPHGRRSVTTSLDCVGTPAVAVLCESDWPSSACVVQLERKKNKRVSVIVGNRKVLKKASNHHQLPSNHHKVPSNHHKAPSNHHKVIIN